MMLAALSGWTTLGVGGPADEMVFPETVDDAAAVVRRCAASGLPWRALGKGSNLLVDDAGVRGVVINTQRLRDISVAPDGRVRAGAGVATSVLMRRTMDGGLGGLECLVGYPATVGGAARMNAGGRWGETGARIEDVVAIDAAGEIVTVSAADCAFGYRHSALGRMLVVEVGFRLPQVDVAAYRLRISEIHREKAAAQPLKEPSAGCVFRNPVGASAGRLIDQAGLKGRAVGGAMVSNVHGNFIVNRGGAAATDVLRLIDTMREAVLRSSGIELRTEVEIWRRG
ncbi:MAG: UDP-N-acetylmuramate dehydrogenase [Planctomycetes bacterium]|nr:UDP-N-acetylmuramate dehydrogenase [Planctomycetota bacterium]